MKNVKEVVEGIGNIFSNPKLKGIAQLIFWIIFFFIVAMIFRSSKVGNIKNNEIINDDNNSNNNVVSNYEYEYTYNDDNGTILVLGTYFDGEESFNMNGVKYYQLNNIYYDAITKEVVDLVYAFGEWKYNSIKNIIDNNPYINQTKYKNGSEKYEYNIDKNVYNDYYGTNYENDIIITVNKVDNIINNASINYGFGSVNVKYTNINNIDKLDINIKE